MRPRGLDFSRTQAFMAAMRASRRMKSICSARMPNSRLRSTAEGIGRGSDMDGHLYIKVEGRMACSIRGREPSVEENPNRIRLVANPGRVVSSNGSPDSQSEQGDNVMRKNKDSAIRTVRVKKGDDLKTI